MTCDSMGVERERDIFGTCGWQVRLSSSTASVLLQSFVSSRCRWSHVDLTWGVGALCARLGTVGAPVQPAGPQCGCSWLSRSAPRSRSSTCPEDIKDPDAQQEPRQHLGLVQNEGERPPTRCGAEDIKNQASTTTTSTVSANGELDTSVRNRTKVKESERTAEPRQETFDNAQVEGTQETASNTKQSGGLRRSNRPNKYNKDIVGKSER